jgi:hypothetical protein
MGTFVALSAKAIFMSCIILPYAPGELQMEPET